MARFLLFAALLSGYCAAFAHLGPPRRGPHFDPLDRQGRQIELAIEAGQFDEALPVARALRTTYPASLDVLYWLGETYRGLGRVADEIEAWREYARVSASPGDVCPALPLALARAGDPAGALREFEACVSHDPGDPDRLIDLAEEHARQGQVDRARIAYKQARALDPGDPRIPRRLAELPRRDEAGR